jgi:hypothetical protein
MRKYSTKLVNIFTIALASIFFLSVLVATVAGIEEDARIALEFEQLMDQVDQFNYDHGLEIVPQADTGPVEALFENGTDAFLHAYYEEYINKESYHVVTKGTSKSVATAVGIKITMFTESQNTMIKFKDGSAIYELLTYEEGNANDRNGSKFFYYESETNIIYLQESDIVYKDGDELIGEYDENNWYYADIQFFKDTLGILPGESIYAFSERAVEKEIYYKEEKENGKVIEYRTIVESNTVLAAKAYQKVIKFIGDAVGTPQVTEMITTAVIGGDGKLKTLTMADKFSLVVDMFGGVDVDIDSTSIYYFISIGEDITFERPIIEDPTDYYE